MTADTYSSSLGVILMGTGNDNNTWGSNLNTSAFQILEDAAVNQLSSIVIGGTLDLSGTPPPAAASQARYSALIFVGTLLSDQIIQVPNLPKMWLVDNATSGAFTLKFKTPSGSVSLAVPQNAGWQLVQWVSSNSILVWPFNSRQILMQDGVSANAPEYSNANEPNSGWRRAATQDWRLRIGGADVLQVTGAGGSPASIFNILSPNVLQLNGSQIIPAGTEFPYAGITLPAGYLWEDGSAYSRTTYATLFAALTATLTGNTHTTTTVDNLSTDLTSYGLVDAFVEGTGVPTGTTIVSIAATSMVLSAAATGTASGVSLRILPWGQGDASTTFNVPDRRERTLFGRGGMNGTSSPGRITLYDATRLNIGLGAESLTIAQGNLPNVNFGVSGAVNITDTHKHFLANTDSVAGSPALTSGNQIAQVGVNSSAPSAYILNGTATAASIGLSSTTSAGSITAALAGAVAASGGSGTAIKKIDPGGVTNWVIKT